MYGLIENIDWLYANILLLFPSNRSILGVGVTLRHSGCHGNHKISIIILEELLSMPRNVLNAGLVVLGDCRWNMWLMRLFQTSFIV